MTALRLRPAAVPCALAACLVLLGGCGGGAPDETGAAAAMDTGTRLRAQAATVSATAAGTEAVTAADLFDWAEYVFPTLFPRPASLPDTPFSFEGVAYTIRGYGNGNYLGLTADGQVRGLGPFTGFQLTGFGRLSDHAAFVQADRCRANPAACSTVPGLLNGCTAPAETALAAGTRLRLQYVLSGTSAQGAVSGESTLESVVEGPASFEGQAAVRTRSTTTTTLDVAGVAVGSTTEGSQFAVAAADGLMRTLGSQTETSTASSSGVSTRVQVVLPRPRPNSEFTLAPGQSLTISEESSVTTTQVTAQGPLTPATATRATTRTHVYEARESITVQGRSHDTCRYRSFDPAQPAASTQQWLIRGLGVPARSIETQANGATTTLELRSALRNGAPV